MSCLGRIDGPEKNYTGVINSVDERRYRAAYDGKPLQIRPAVANTPTALAKVIPQVTLTSQAHSLSVPPE